MSASSSPAPSNIPFSFDEYIRSLNNHITNPGKYPNPPAVTLEQIKKDIFPVFPSSSAAVSAIASKIDAYVFLYKFIAEEIIVQNNTNRDLVSFFLGSTSTSSSDQTTKTALLQQIASHMKLVNSSISSSTAYDSNNKEEKIKFGTILKYSQIIYEAVAKSMVLSPSSTLSESDTKKLLSKVYLNGAVNNKLKRFIKAQDQAKQPLSTAMAQLKAGKKTSHWIWYIFPQFLDPGRSSIYNSEYQIHGQIEAVAYLLHKDLGQRTRDLFSIVKHQLCDMKNPVCSLMTTEVDAKKLHHCASTFRLAAASLVKKNEEVGGAIEKLVPGETWQAVAELHEKLLPDVIDAIRQNPYRKILPQGFTECPEHDPVIVATWNKTEVWFV